MSTGLRRGGKEKNNFTGNNFSCTNNFRSRNHRRRCNAFHFGLDVVGCRTCTADLLCCARCPRTPRRLVADVCHRSDTSCAREIRFTNGFYFLRVRALPYTHTHTHTRIGV
uniref:Uncharacterized protein n=1 Tax=Sipha flava TaxID=143950 RepID=A0A2S2QN62_9HEMI